MKKCDSYHVRKERRYLNDFEKGYYYALGIKKDYIEEEVTECYGTRECDPCSCGGDRTKCDFYEDVRKKAKAELKKAKDKVKRDPNAICPICGYPLYPNEKDCGCQCYYAGSCHPDRSKRESVVYEHLYLLSSDQLKHIIDLQRKKQISYADEEKNRIVEELKKNKEKKHE